MDLSWYFCGAVEMSLWGGGGKGKEVVLEKLHFPVAGMSFFLKTKNLKTGQNQQESNAESVSRCKHWDKGQSCSVTVNLLIYVIFLSSSGMLCLFGACVLKNSSPDPQYQIYSWQPASFILALQVGYCLKSKQTRKQSPNQPTKTQHDPNHPEH